MHNPLKTVVPVMVFAAVASACSSGGGGAVNPEITILPGVPCSLEIVAGNDACSVETGCVVVRNQSETDRCENEQMFLVWWRAEDGQEPMRASGQTMIIRPPGDPPIEPGETRYVETGFSPFIRPIGFENHVWACIYGPGRVRPSTTVEWDCSRRFRNVRF